MKIKVFFTFNRLFFSKERSASSNFNHLLLIFTTFTFMFARRLYILLMLLFGFGGILSAQTTEYYFSFRFDRRSELDSLSQIISIDKVSGDKAWAYANEEEMQLFRQTKHKYKICEPRAAKGINMATTVAMMADWDRYPTYSVYDSMMHQYAEIYPDICSLSELSTLESGRRILALKISSQVSSTVTDKPEILCSANIHGDECVCMATTLRMCDYILTNRNNPTVKRLIDSTEMWLIPLVNPDGMYRGDDNTIGNASRSNANGYDLNRNFPYVSGTNSNELQDETIALIQFYGAHHFSLAICLHAGDECFNYPWDTGSSILPNLTADDKWWRLVGGNYRDTAQFYGPSRYFRGVSNGLTLGRSWYAISGGQQDFSNYFMHCREATIEISDSKTPSSDELPSFWNGNRNALLNFFGESLNGVRGIVTDAGGQPLFAKITIDGHDKDNSWIETDPRAGDYHRYLKAGTYNITFTVDGYPSKTIDNVVVKDGQPTWLDVVFSKLSAEADCLPVEMKPDTTAQIEIVLHNDNSVASLYTLQNDTISWLTADKAAGEIAAGQTDTIRLTVNSAGLAAGNYSAQCLFQTNDGTVSVTVSLAVTAKNNPDNGGGIGNQQGSENGSENGNNGEGGNAGNGNESGNGGETGNNNGGNENQGNNNEENNGNEQGNNTENGNSGNNGEGGNGNENGNEGNNNGGESGNNSENGNENGNENNGGTNTTDTTQQNPPIDTTSIAEQLATPTIYVRNNIVVVENATGPVRIFDIAGHCIDTKTANGHTEFVIRKTGIYIVKTRSAAMRIVIE